MNQQDVATLIEQVTLGNISLEDAAAQLQCVTQGAALPPPDLTCATCQHFFPNRPADGQGACHQFGQPEHAESALSIRCYHYEQRDERAAAMPADTIIRKNCMFK